MSEVAATPGPWRKVAALTQSVKVEQTLFTLPFAYLTLFLVAGGVPDGATLGWITLAMAAARTFGMSANRLIDAEIDARNPRTAGRPLPTGVLRHRDVVVFMAASVGVFLLAVFHLSAWARYLWPVPLAAMTLYPYMKRFTWACHFGLFGIYLMVPTGVWLAVTSHLAWGPVLMGLGAGFWVAGFDVIYGTQDIRFDRESGLHSIPARFGLAKALLAAKAFHLLTVGLIAVAGVAFGAGAWYYLGVVAFLLLVMYEHRLVAADDLSKVNVAFFNMNGIISVVFFLFVMTDVLLK